MLTTLIELELLIYALLGNVLLWVDLVNRAQSIHWPVELGKKLWFSALIAALLSGILIIATYHVELPQPLSIWDTATPGDGIWGRLQHVVSVVLTEYWSQGYYLFPLLWAVTALWLINWAVAQARRFQLRRFMLGCTTKRYDMSDIISEQTESIHPLIRLPGNQMLQPEVTIRELAMPGLAPSLDGMTIALLSDLHVMPGMPQRYFDWIVDQTNRMQPDLVLIAGDLHECPGCIDRVATLLGGLDRSVPRYFVLGNHDLSKDPPTGDRIREAVQNVGLIDLSGVWRTVRLRGEDVVLAGSERPYGGRNPDMSGAPSSLRILLSHSPDQVFWAARQRFDLVLAGHLHGGQCRIPLIGPLLSPSRYGLRFAHGDGLFRVGRRFRDKRGTLMQVSRGIGGDIPVRYFCRPELIGLRLRVK